VLQVPKLTRRRAGPGSARLYYAYADALLDAGREEEAREWFGRAAAADPDGETDAAERFEDLDPVVFDYLADAEEADGQEDDRMLADADDGDVPSAGP
jgi:tetratricopeptide (TPR) repeat protein